MIQLFTTALNMPGPRRTLGHLEQAAQEKQYG